MAALDDELESDLPGYTPTRSTYETGEAPAAPVSALDGEDEEEVGYGGGGGGDDLAGATLARLRPAPAGSPRALLRQVLEQRLAERQAAPAAPVGFGVIGRDPEALRRMIVPDAGEVIYSRPEAEKPPEDTSSWTSILGRGLLRANEGLMQGKDIAEGKRPRTSKTEAAEYEKPMELADFLSPTTLAEKTVFSLAASYPAVALSIAGGLAGGAIGTAVSAPTVVGTPVGATVGTIAGGAAGMGIGAALQELGPAYHAELEALGENPTQEGLDKAWDNALVQVGKTGAVNAASMALLGAGKPLSNALKGLWTKPILDAAGKAAPVVAGVPTRVGVQVAGQPAVAVGGEVVYNAAEGKPLTENLNPAAAGAAANVAQDVTAAALGRFGRAVGRRVAGRGEVTPGVSDDQKLALDATQPPQQGPPMPPGMQPGPGGTPLTPGAVPPGRRFGTPEPPPPPPPPPGGPGGADLGGGPAGPGGAGVPPPRPPPGGGPGGTPLGPEPVTPGGMPPPPPSGGPTGPGPGGTPLGPEPVPGPPRPPGGPGPGGTPLGPEPVPPRPAAPPPPEPPPPPPPPGGPGGMPLGDQPMPPRPAVPPPPEPPPPPGGEPPGVSRIQRAAGMEEPPVPPIAPAVEGIGPRSRIQEQYGTPGVGERTLIEPDHLDATRSVAKNEGGDVIGKGATAEEALADAQARQRAPYEEQATAAEQAKPAAPRTKSQPAEPHNLLKPGEEPAAEPIGVSPILDAVLGRSHQSAEAREQLRAAQAEAAERAPPAGAAKPEPAASGRDAVPETPVKQTPAEAVKAKGDAKQAAKKATAEAKAAEVKAKGEARAKPPQGERDVTQEVREGVLTDAEDATRVRAMDEFEKNLGRTLAERKGSDTARNNERARQLDAWEAGFDVGLRGSLMGPQSNNVVTSFRAGREAGRGIRESRVTKSAEELRTETGTKTPPVTKSGGTEKVAPATGRQKLRQEEYDSGYAAGLNDKPLIGPRSNAPDLVKSFKEGREAGIRDRGTRTKAGAYVSPGEAAEAQAPRPVRAQPTEMQEGARSESARHTTQSSHTLARRMAPEPTEKFPLTPGLNTVRKAGEVIKNILAGQKLADAIEAFGKKEPGSVGRPRKVETLSSHIRQFLKEADTSTAEQSRRQALDATVARLKKLPPEPVPGEASPQRRAILDDLNKQLKQLDEVRANRAQLEDAATQIEALEAGSRGPKSIRRRITDLVSGATTPFEFLAKRREVNEPILQHIQRSGDAGASLHRLLDDFIASRHASGMTPQLTELARILRRVVPDTKVRQGEGIIPGDAVGSYDPVGGDIYLNTRAARQDGNAAVTLLHETIHKPTVDYVNHLYRTPEANLNPQELAHKFALESIRGEIDRVYVEGGPRTGSEDFELGYAGTMYDTPYLTGPHELATQLLTQPELHRFLSRETASPEFRQALESVGMGIGQKASIWDGFKRIVRNIFGVPDKLDSVFDYVLRPLTEIVETGAKFRTPRDVAEINQIRRQNAEVLGPAKLRDTAKWLRDAAANFADPKGRAALRGAFQLGNLQFIHDIIKPYIPSVTAHRIALDAVKHASDAESVRQITTYDNNGRAITEANMDKTNRLSNQLRASPEVREISRLMSDVQYAGMSVIDPARNAHLGNNEAQRQIQQGLQNRFDALSPESQQIYREHSALRDEWHRATREAKIEELTETSFPDLTPAERTTIKNQFRTRQGTMDVLNNFDTTAIATQLGLRAENKKLLAQAIAESQRIGFVDGDYFGLRRNGEYIVSYGNPRDLATYGVEHFETVTEAQVRKEQLERGSDTEPARNDVSQVFTKSKVSPAKLFQNPEQALGTLERGMERGGITGDQAAVLRDLYATELIQQGTRAATHTMRREGIRGATEDYARTLMGDHLAHNARMGHLKHGVEVNRTLFQAERENSAFRHSGANAFEVALAETGVRELRKRQLPADGDSTTDMIGNGARALTSWTVASALIRPAHFFMNLAGGHAAASALIGGKHGIVTANYEVAKALTQMTGTAAGVARRDALASMRKEMSAANWDTLQYYRERLKRAGDISPENADLLADRMDVTNLVNQSRTREMRRMAGPQGYMAGHDYLARGMDVFSAAEHAADSAMRFAIAKAAFVTDLRKNGGRVDMALDFAEQVARDSMPDYNQKSRFATPQGSLGKFAPIATQFRQFGLHMLGVQANLLATGARDANPAVRAEARKTLALLHAQHMLWTGVGGAVFGGLPMMVGLGVWDFVHGEDPHTNKELEIKARNAVRDIAGKNIADVFAYGIPMLAGLDVHRSLQFTNLTGIPEWRSHDKEGALNFAVQMLGPSADQAAGMIDSTFKLMQGDLRLENAAKMMPRVIRDPTEALFLWRTEGVKTARGDRTILPAEQLSTANLLAKAAGFIPSPVSDARLARSAIDVAHDVREARQEPYLRKLVLAIADKRDTKEALAEIMRFNNTPGMPDGDKITGGQIQRRLREQAISKAMPGNFGMQVPRKQYGSVEELTRFARP